MSIAPRSPGPVEHPLSEERVDYRSSELVESAAPENPFPLFAQWLAEAKHRRDAHGDLPEPSAAVLSNVDLGPVTEAGTVPGSATSRARPRSRTVLLKHADRHGFVVFTHQESDKGQQLSRNPWASLVLPWIALQRQVRIDGAMEPVADAESDAYFASRPRGSQLGAWASEQSRPISDRAALDAQYARVAERFAGTDVPRPPHWGGYRLTPDRIEFWQGRTDRLHDRLVYEADGGGGWRRTRLQP